MPETIMTTIRNLFSARSKPGGKLWSQDSEFDEAWKGRISRMASYIDKTGTVADFGCGMMWLEQFLAPGNVYLPIDYIRRDERTLVVDFNNDPFPKISGEVAFLSGSLEYVKDIKGFLRNLMNAGFPEIVISYCTIDKYPDMRARRALNWVSHESIFSILEIFCEQYSLAKIDNSVEANTILVFRRKA
jgi:hypothetical protein